MESLENILSAWEKDAEINATEPGRELIRIPKLHSKYIRFLVEAKGHLKTHKNELARHKKIKYAYYNGAYNTDKEFLKEKGWEPFKLILKSDIGTYLDSDDDLIKISDKITYYENIILACEMILQELKQRTWQLKSHIDFERFVNGG